MKILKNKVYLIFVIVFIIVIVIALVGIFQLIIPSSSKNLYGNRLDGIENYVIANDKLSNTKDLLLQNTDALSVEYNIKGKIVNYIITLKQDADLVDAKALAAVIIKEFTVEQKSFYDFQVFFTTNEESEIFPIIGYKHVSSLDFVWTNN